MKRALIIVNPRARGVDNPAHLCGESQRLLDQCGIAVTVGVAPDGQAATRAAQQAVSAGFDLVIAAGGDGTINHVAQGLAGTGMALGFIPLGTGNSLAFEHGLVPGDLRGACAVIAAGHTRLVDLGVINDRVFLGMADIGVTALVQRQVSRRWKARLGVAALGAQLLRALPRVRPWQFRARLDELSLTGKMWGMFLIKGRRHVWRVPLDLPGTDDDGLLQVVILGECSRQRLLALVRDVAVWHVPSAHLPEVSLYSARAVELETCPAVPWEVDGEVERCTPISAHVSPQALRLIVPAGPTQAGPQTIPDTAR